MKLRLHYVPKAMQPVVIWLWIIHHSPQKKTYRIWWFDAISTIYDDDHLHLALSYFFSPFSSAMQIGSVRAIRRIHIEFVNFDDLFKSPFRPDRNYQWVRIYRQTLRNAHIFVSHTFSPIRANYYGYIFVMLSCCWVELGVGCTVYGPSFIKRAPHSLL